MSETPKTIFAVRLPNRQFQSDSGPVDNVSQANYFPSLEAALEAADKNASGVSEYTAMFDPLVHMSLEDAQKAVTQKED